MSQKTAIAFISPRHAAAATRAWRWWRDNSAGAARLHRW
jgi:hypothetical protein